MLTIPLIRIPRDLPKSNMAANRPYVLYALPLLVAFFLDDVTCTTTSSRAIVNVTSSFGDLGGVIRDVILPDASRYQSTVFLGNYLLLLFPKNVSL